MRTALLVLALVAPAAAAAADGEMKNWFGDPFFRISDEIAACPEPVGPLMTEEEKLRDSHHRNERGLRCYLEKRCKYPSSYTYDAEIAEHIKTAVRDGRMKLPRSTLWVMVQGRRVWIYGCVPEGYRRGTLRDQLRRIPDVELATEEVRVGARGAVEYRARPARVAARP